CVMGDVVLFSFSREGMLWLLVTAILAFVLIPKRPCNFVIFTLAFIAVLSLAGAEVQERFASIFIDPVERDRSAESRLRLWADCYDAMTRKPILGYGPGQFSVISQEYGWPEGKQGHSIWLQIGAELGVPGLAFLIAFYGLCALKL